MSKFSSKEKIRVVRRYLIGNESAKTKTYSVAIKSEEHLDQEVFQEAGEFKCLVRERYKIEAKNSELKNKHGYNQASAAGLFGMQVQKSTMILVVNLKILLIFRTKRGNKQTKNRVFSV